ncbi:hypothetical protein EV368DRAFT_65571 [Lentinula lateritia]|uniref:Uncharacterized protein n=1 Tax=Lentinula aff. lateritia TaxID=2804960 RepID=A0ACC1TY75_9AGAR|nr:hypothetical protein F5876DRAFT_66272 [Lentinula aff. lateritia]KAJ3851677.1 hypothetical protein EV368DRAFT_65571 [Lentinula lateritia]
MLFLTTLLPLITLALRVAAADLEQGIPLGSVSRPADVHLTSDPPPPHEAPEANPIIPTVHYGSNAQQSVSPPCLEEAEQQALAHVRQQMPHATNLRVFVGRLAEAKDRLQNYVKGVMPQCKIAVVVAGVIVLVVYAETECHRKDETIQCKHWRRNKLTDGLKIERCERLPIKIDACSNPFTTDRHLSSGTFEAPGGHVKMDSARMSYRRRLEWSDQTGRVADGEGGASNCGEEDEGCLKLRKYTSRDYVMKGQCLFCETQPPMYIQLFHRPINILQELLHQSWPSLRRASYLLVIPIPDSLPIGTSSTTPLAPVNPFREAKEGDFGAHSAADILDLLGDVHMREGADKRGEESAAYPNRREERRQHETVRRNLDQNVDLVVKNCWMRRRAR